MDHVLSSAPPPAGGAGWRKRLVAAAMHLVASAAVAGVAAALVFGLWYPMPYREISGGRELFLLIIGVDVVIGPLLTLTIFDLRKSRRELQRDIAVVLLLQLAALGYGLHTVFVARPVVVALEPGPRLRVVRAIDLPPAELALAPAGLRQLPWRGVQVVATRMPSADERFEAIQLGLAGVDLGMRPGFWLPAEATPAVLRQQALPLDRLHQRRGGDDGALGPWLSATGRPAVQLGYLPLLARRSDWVALIDLESGEVVGHAPVDGF